MDLRNVDEDWLIKELRKKLPSFDYPPEHRKLVGYANSLTSPESQGEMINAMFGVTAPVGDLTKLAIGHSNLKSASMQALEDALNSRRATNIEKKLPFDTSTGSVRDEIARRNAVDMLGLPEANTALDRANVMFPREAYHGTPGYDSPIQNFGSEVHRGQSTGAESAKIADWVTDNPQVAMEYANMVVSQPPSEEMMIVKTRINELTEKLKIERHNITTGTPIANYSAKELSKYNKIVKPKLKEFESRPDVLAIKSELDDLFKLQNKLRAENDFDSRRPNILPMRVKDATTFDPKQSSALAQLNEIIGQGKQSVDKINNAIKKLPGYSDFESSIISEFGGKNPIDYLEHALSQQSMAQKEKINASLPNVTFWQDVYNKSYKNFVENMLPQNPSIMDNYAQYRAFEMNPDITKQINKNVGKIPTVYDAKGKSYDQIPGGLTYKLNNAPEGTEVFRFNNLVDPEPASTHYAIMKPNAVRSRFAAFDPARRSSSDLLAGVAAGSLSLQALLDLLNEDQYR